MFGTKKLLAAPKVLEASVESREEETVKSENSNMSTIKAADTDTERNHNQLASKVFHNPLIMESITRHLPLRVLPTLRSTCKLWNEIMMPDYRDRKSNGNYHLVKVDKVSIDSVLHKLNGCTANPFSAYKFKDVEMYSSKVQKLIVKIGGVMTHLELNLKKISLGIATFRTLIFKQCPVLSSLQIKDKAKLRVPRFWKCKLLVPRADDTETQTLPNLKNITVTIVFEKITKYSTTDFVLLNDLFKVAINLEIVQIGHGAGRVLNGVVLDMLKLKEGNLHKIKEIKLGKGVSINHLESLVELSSRKSTANKLGLKELDLRQFLKDACFIDVQGHRLLKQFLRLQASSLEKLTASLISSPLHDGNNNHVKYRLTLPVMTSLKTLKLQIEYFSQQNGNINNANNGDMLLPNITFDSLNTNFPNLQKLKILPMNWMWKMWMYESYGDEEEQITIRQDKQTQFMAQLGLGSQQPHHGITELNVTLFNESNYLDDYASLFPNVKSLKIGFKTSLFPEVWSVWPSLELINIRIQFSPAESEIDSTITGIPRQSLELLKTSSASSKVEVGEEKMELNWKEYKTQAGINDLDELREFKLRYMTWPVQKKQYMTDLSAYYGFIPSASSHKLRTIHIRECTNFSSECVVAVEAALGPHGDFIPFNEVSKRLLEESSRICVSLSILVDAEGIHVINDESNV